jgi:antitoxin component YwqK of YwqJK toxin-antitoxin module
MRVDIDDTDNDPDDPSRYLHEGEPFTGEIVETTPAGVVVTEFSVVAGLQHGSSRTWYGDGTLKTESTVERGVAVGTARLWHPNGQLAEERDFDERGHNVARRRWTADGTPVPA